jgi:tetratricopeptide (TPR) repeat protein
MAKVALLIGVSEYEPGLKPLPAAIKDIEAMRQVLQHPDMGDFAASNINVLKNPERQEMEEAIQALFNDRHRDDLVLFFFSGHGIKDSSGRLYLSCRKTRKTPKGNLLSSTATSASFIHENIKHSRSRRQVIILDCCYSGAFAEGMLAKDDGSIDIRSQLGSEGGAVLTSSSSIEYSFEQQDSELSVYTRYLVEGLATGDADQDRDGFIAIGELHEYAKRKVQETAPQMKPEIYPSKEGYNIRLARVPPTDPALRYHREIERLASLSEITFAPRTFADQVQEWLSMPLQDNVRISSARRKMLEVYRQKLGLSPETASKIESEALEFYREFYKKLESYEQELVKELRREKPLKDSVRRRLKELQHVLQIPDEHAIAIEQRISPRIKYSPYLGLQALQRLTNFSQPSLLTIVLVAFLSVGISAYLVKVLLVDQQQNDRSFVSSKQPFPSITPPEPSPQTNGNELIDSKTSLDFNASSDTQVIADTHNQNGITQYNLGNQSYEQKSFDLARKYYLSAIKEFDQAINQKRSDLQFRDAYLYVNRGNAYFAVGEKQLALKDYNKAVELKPNDETLPKAYEGRGDARFDFYGDKQGAIEDYEKALSRYINKNMAEDTGRVKSKLLKLQKD